MTILWGTTDWLRTEGEHERLIPASSPSATRTEWEGGRSEIGGLAPGLPSSLSSFAADDGASAASPAAHHGRPAPARLPRRRREFLPHARRGHAPAPATRHLLAVWAGRGGGKDGRRGPRPAPGSTRPPSASEHTRTAGRPPGASYATRARPAPPAPSNREPGTPAWRNPVQLDAEPLGEQPRSHGRGDPRAGVAGGLAGARARASASREKTGSTSQTPPLALRRARARRARGAPARRRSSQRRPASRRRTRCSHPPCRLTACRLPPPPRAESDAFSRLAAGLTSKL